MTDRPSRPSQDDRRPQDLAPETDNAEQDRDADRQAQTVAEEARNRTAEDGLGDSEKVPTGDDSDDVQDLVDHMKQMNSSGRIDMSAYRGERNDDDEEGLLGEQGEEDEDE